MALIIALSLSLAALCGFGVALWHSLKHAPHLRPGPLPSGRLSVIVPAYNEEENIEACLRAVLHGVARDPAREVEVIVVDDQSTDGTRAVLERLSRELADPRLVVLHGEPRAEGKWLGKNWACAQGAQKAIGDYLLFVDADVRIAPNGIDAALAHAHAEDADLLTMAPALECGCAAEWIVQPIMVEMMGVRFDFDRVHDPDSSRAFACGPFMLFRRAAYDAVGGHEAVAREVVEDVMLARRIKGKRLRLRLVIGLEAATLRMYPSFAALWEGWTKSIYFAMERSTANSLGSAVLISLLFPFPWIAFPVAAALRDPIAIGLSLGAIFMQYILRKVTEKYFGLTARYWWAGGLGGALLVAMTIVSIVKWKLGWGWTWRGRSLANVAKREA